MHDHTGAIGQVPAVARLRYKARKAWMRLQSRCLNPEDKDYARYGARGITVCERWRASFDNFLADVGLPPSLGHTIDRVDNQAGYAPGNCRWCLWVTQANNRSTNVRLEYGGYYLTMAEWARFLGVTRKVIWKRWRVLGWPLERVLSPWPERLEKAA